MKRREFLAAAAAFQRSRRPNILFVLPDQLRAQSLGCMGNTEVKSPNFDRLASEGVLFRNTVANSPVCCPARAILMTGQYCHRNGMIANDLRLRESSVTIAETLAQSGYRTGFIGKWHLDGGPRLPGFIPPGPRRQGFQYWAANECSHAHFQTHYFRDTPEPIPIKDFEPTGWTDAAIEFLRESSRGADPFFLCVFMGPPHDPYKAPEQFAKLYDPARLRMRPNWKEAEGVAGRADLAQYYASITAVDEQMGRLMLALDDLGMTDDTIVLVSSDHGDMLGSHGMSRKRKPHEESIRVPGIVRYPRRVKGVRTEDALFSHIDFVPTLLSLCDVRPPSGLQGADLSGLVLGKKSKGPESAFFQIFGPFAPDSVDAGWRGVRTQRYTYARHRDKPWVLFDLKEDPYQLNNLVGDSAAARVLRDMEAHLATWMKRTGDSWDFDWTERVEEGGRLYRTKAYYTVGEYLSDTR